MCFPLHPNSEFYPCGAVLMNSIRPRVLYTSARCSLTSAHCTITSAHCSPVSYVFPLYPRSESYPCGAVLISSIRPHVLYTRARCSLTGTHCTITGAHCSPVSSDGNQMKRLRKYRASLSDNLKHLPQENSIIFP